MTDDATEIAAIVNRLRHERRNEDHLPPEMCGLGTDDCDEAADIIDRLFAALAERDAEIRKGEASR